MSNDARKKTAAFFDVDGTLIKTNIVHYYVYFKRNGMSLIYSQIWHAIFLIKCLYYLLLDKIDRSKLNVVFYRNYAGMSVEEVKGLMPNCYRDIIQPKRFAQAEKCLEEHRQAGRSIVLVTGSIDFIIAPLAADLKVTDVVCPSLIESEGRFTGDLDGPPVGDQEKAKRMLAYAQDHDIDLSQSYAYGDSIADLPMLETVGFPQTVNPDKSLAKTARARGWPIHSWNVKPLGSDHNR